MAATQCRYVCFLWLLALQFPQVALSKRFAETVPNALTAGNGTSTSSKKGIAAKDDKGVSFAQVGAGHVRADMVQAAWAAIAKESPGDITKAITSLLPQRCPESSNDPTIAAVLPKLFPSTVRDSSDFMLFVANKIGVAETIEDITPSSSFDREKSVMLKRIVVCLSLPSRALATEDAENAWDTLAESESLPQMPVLKFNAAVKKLFSKKKAESYDYSFKDTEDDMTMGKRIFQTNLVIGQTITKEQFVAFVMKHAGDPWEMPEDEEGHEALGIKQKEILQEVVDFWANEG